MIGTVGQTSVREKGETFKVPERDSNVKVENSSASICSVSSYNAMYVPGLVGGQPLKILVDWVSSDSCISAGT